MNDKFDELTKGLALSVTRRAALKKFGIGLAGIALAALGLVTKAQAGNKHYHCNCKIGYDYGCTARYGNGSDGLACINYCGFHCQGPVG